MAVDFSKTEHTRTSEYLIAPKDIDVNPKLNGRVDLPDIEWLIADFKLQGQLEPCGIRNDGGQAVLAYGHSRWRAGVEGIKRGILSATFKLRCVYFKGNEQDAFKANIAENRYRNATTAMDDAHNIAMLEKWGQTIPEIAALYRESEVWIKTRLKMIELTPEAQKAVKDGRLKPTAAVAIAKLSAEQQRERVKGTGKVKAPKKVPVENPANAKKPDVWDPAATLDRVKAAVMAAIEESLPKSELRLFAEKLQDMIEKK